MGSGLERDRIVVIDERSNTVERANEDGLAGIHGSAASAALLTQAGVGRARAIVVAPDRDDTAVLITLTARELNRSATIVSAIRGTENAHLLRESGADSVITSSDAAGRLLGIATHSPTSVEVLEDLLAAGSGLDLVERPAREGELGGPPPRSREELVVAVVRDGDVIRFDDDRATRLEAGDRLVCLCGNRDD